MASNFILLHLKINNSAVCINCDSVSCVVKDTPVKSSEEVTCVFLKEGMTIKRVFVNESIERVYNLICSAGQPPKEQNSDEKS